MYMYLCVLQHSGIRECATKLCPGEGSGGNQSKDILSSLSLPLTLLPSLSSLSLSVCSTYTALERPAICAANDLS